MVKMDICPRCMKKPYRVTAGVCHNCYRKYIWKRKKAECKNCKRRMFIQAWGFCTNCYNKLNHYDRIKSHNYRKWHNIDLETYRKITKQCVMCGFDKIVDLHHLDHDHKNNSQENLIGLCPNHHRMVHIIQYRDELTKILEEKGYKIPEKHL